jgi:hypothetical protein
VTMKSSSTGTGEPFFLEGQGSYDYLSIRDGQSPVCASVRDFIEGVWPYCKPYLDLDTRTDARANFHQRWWEIYLTHSLLCTGVQLVKRESRQSKKYGPDLLAQIDERNVWIEAVAPTAGTAADAVRSGGPSRAPKPFPEKEIMLRFQQSFSEKARVYAKYAEKSWIDSSEGYIIALNGALVERSYPCMQRFPRIVSALLLGLEKEHVVIEFDEERSRIGQSVYEYQSEIQKKSNEPVGVAALRDPTNSCVSAVLYSSSDAYSCLSLNSSRPSECALMEKEFVLVLNPHARAPIDPGFVSNIARYWIELNDDGCTLHSSSDAGPTLPWSTLPSK